MYSLLINVHKTRIGSYLPSFYLVLLLFVPGLLFAVALSRPHIDEDVRKVRYFAEGISAPGSRYHGLTPVTQKQAQNRTGWRIEHNG